MKAAPLLTVLLHRLFPDNIPIENDTSCGEDATREDRHDHIIIVGYGLTGRCVARAAELAGIPSIAIDLDPEVIRTEQKTCLPVTSCTGIQRTKRYSPMRA
jgi:CPA2 family monovalent cation:H+ antiporter-2